MLVLNRIHRIPTFARMQSEMNAMFNAAANAATGTLPTAAMNVWEDDTKYFIEAELPGFRMEDLEVSVLGDEVTIKGQRNFAEPANAAYLCRERRAGTFSRTFTLPNPMQADKVEASLTDGVLLITLPKTPAVQRRKIAVKSGK
jgi:HSP20 family protein